MIGRSVARFAAVNLAALAVGFMALVWLSRDGALDLTLAGAFFDPAAGVFPLKDAPLLAQAGHTGLKWLALAIWLTAVALAVASAKVAVLRPWRAPLVFFSVAVAVTVLSVTLLRRVSAHSCPWDLSVFGGPALWFPLFDAQGAAPGPGRCWPSGHAAGGFSLLAGYFALRDRRPHISRIAFATALGLGALMSLVQMARGAHLLTHNLWSLWLAWLCCCVSYVVWHAMGHLGGFWQNRPPCSAD